MDTVPTFRPLKLRRIAWRIHATGATGHGEWAFHDRESLAPVVAAMNAEYRDSVSHWIEEQETTP